MPFRKVPEPIKTLQMKKKSKERANEFKKQ